MFCLSGEVVNEEHFNLSRSSFNTKRACFMGEIISNNPKFSSLGYEIKLKTIMCPKTTIEVKVVNKYIRIMCLARDNLSYGLDILN